MIYTSSRRGREGEGGRIREGVHVLVFVLVRRTSMCMSSFFLPSFRYLQFVFSVSSSSVFFTFRPDLLHFFS